MVYPVRSKSLLANKNLWRFAIAFAIGLLIFVSENVISYRQMLRGPELTDVPVGFGFPFKLYGASGFGGEWIIWSGLISDILIAGCVSAIIGLIARH